MKILHISESDIKGGAARATMRLHKALLEKNVESGLLVQRKSSNEPKTFSAYDSTLGFAYASLRSKIGKQLNRFQITQNPALHSSNFIPSSLHRKINKSDADLVHLHWINNEMISVKEISKINKPIVWTLHDMWAFSGAEHYDNLANPGRYKTGYSKDNRPDTHRGLDIDRWTWKRKKKYWNGKSFNIITPSQWLFDCASNSALFKNEKIKVVPNGIDVETFRPYDKMEVRKKLGLPLDKKLVLYGAVGSQSNPLKGFAKLMKAKEKLSETKGLNHEICFVVFGNKNKYIDNTGFFETRYLGTINDDITLSKLYACSDIMVVPSLLDNLPNTAVEAISCGTPVVSFDIGGLPDIISHKKNGYLATSYDVKDLANGIRWILKNEMNLEKCSKKARRKAINNYSQELIAEEHIEVYKRILKTK